jgi:glutamate-5-semialdehyde dehydrogenase
MAPLSEVHDKGERAKAAAAQLAQLSTATKDAALAAVATALIERSADILAANAQDVAAARQAGVKESLVDRLSLDEKRIAGIAEGLRQIIALPDPIGEVLDGWTRPNGIQVRRIRVPLGVIGMIYESRPNVTVDAAGLCLKSGNAVILRGGSDAIRSNVALTRIIREAIAGAGVPADAVQLIESTDRAAAEELMRLTEFVDVLVPRGGAGLIRTVVETAKVPVLETGVGNCHTFVDASADLAMAEEIAFNAKVQRPGVCNAMETLLVHQAVAAEFLPRICTRLIAAGVEIRGCERTRAIVPEARAATEEDWATEFLALVLAVKVVDSVEEAIAHINRYGTLHSECIVTRDLESATKFRKQVDAAGIFVNVSTRFMDGFELGLGAEIGISTQKLHARGPMGLRELTTVKWVIEGEGQVRG